MRQNGNLPQHRPRAQKHEEKRPPHNLNDSFLGNFKHPRVSWNFSYTLGSWNPLELAQGRRPSPCKCVFLPWVHASIEEVPYIIHYIQYFHMFKYNTTYFLTIWYIYILDIIYQRTMCRTLNIILYRYNVIEYRLYIMYKNLMWKYWM